MYSLSWPIQGCAAVQPGTVFVLSVPKQDIFFRVSVQKMVYNFM